jgi:hypothetical protein
MKIFKMTVLLYEILLLFAFEKVQKDVLVSTLQYRYNLQVSSLSPIPSLKRHHGKHWIWILNRTLFPQTYLFWELTRVETKMHFFIFANFPSLVPERFRDKNLIWILIRKLLPQAYLFWILTRVKMKMHFSIFAKIMRTWANFRKISFREKLFIFAQTFAKFREIFVNISLGKLTKIVKYATITDFAFSRKLSLLKANPF